ncbi:methylated-DNA--[protein]-cysteine S-methyltransferase [Williamsia serinedens]|uniref:Methylated-DNA-[protein]-cysteine S-methyltransferase n=1 Tax=Williamsia serinedens TaxID=391736 RepID=A0ABT1H881_9NOCA|nr:methylated-DNA--[protein]-cysteine S-methyltransferase [Williamsia serinedens]MCP2162008.1 methylated-DNA-[protein]-cysteine S-methyltransferase [Williamsia serinedens]
MTASVGCHVVDTVLGPCGVAWDGEGRVTAVALPDRDAAAVVSHLDVPVADPPDGIVDVADRMSALLAGQDVDLLDVVVADDDLPDFDRRVYDVLRAIPRGAVLTYGEVAARVGAPGAAQAVGRALGRNPFPIVVPCHRVLGAGTEIGGFSAPGGVATKRSILAAEGVAGFGEPTLF